MTKEKHLTVDVNTADVETLSEIPGIGPEIAQRIVAARPFTSLDDLHEASGLDPDTWQRLRGLLIISSNGEQREPVQVKAQPFGPVTDALLNLDADEESPLNADSPSERDSQDESEEPVQEDPASELAPAAIVLQGEQVQAASLAPLVPLPSDRPLVVQATAIVQEEEEAQATPLAEPLAPMPADEPPAEQQSEPAASLPAPEQQATEEPASTRSTPRSAPKSQPTPITRAQVWWIAIVGSMLLLSSGLVINLGILAVLNQGRLQFVTQAQLYELRLEVMDLQGQANTLGQDAQGLRTRLDNLEVLSGRITTMEQTAGEMRTNLDKAALAMDGIIEQADALETQIGALAQQAEAMLAEVDGLDQRTTGVETDMKAVRDTGDRMDTFLDGLRVLLDGSIKPEER